MEALVQNAASISAATLCLLLLKLSLYRRASRRAREHDRW